jgi:hypothetical protein
MTRQPYVAPTALASIDITAPPVGWWMVRLSSQGAEVPACCFWCDYEPGEPENKLDRKPYLVAAIAGTEVDPLEFRYIGRPIAQEEYDKALQRLRWLQDHQPDHPACNPYKPVDVASLPLPTFPTDADL